MTADWYVWQCKLEDATDMRGEVWADFAAPLQPVIEQWAKSFLGDVSLQLGGGYWLACADGATIMQVSPSGAS